MVVSWHHRNTGAINNRQIDLPDANILALQDGNHASNAADALRAARRPSQYWEGLYAV
jgi:hypothetical protein